MKTPLPPSPTAEATATPPPRALTQLRVLQLLDNIPDAVAWLDHSWKLVFANAEARRISRLTDSDLNSKTHWEIFPETIGTELEVRYHRAMATRAPDHIEYYYPPFQTWFDIHVFPIDEGIAIYYRDITEQKRAEASRDNASHKLEQVLESIPDSILCIDRSWNCTYANRAARIILKTDPLIGANLWAAFPLHLQEPFASNYRATMERRIPTEFEAHYPAPLNIWFKVTVHPFEDGIILFSSDITSRKKAEARRDASTRQLEQVFAATNDAVVSIAHDWTFTFLNRRAQELLSVKGDLIGRNLWEEFPAAQEGSFRYNLDRAMTDRIHGEFEDFYPEPLNLWLNVQVSPSDDGIVVFFRDVTAERTFRDALLDQQATLAFLQETAGVATWQIDLGTKAMTFGPGSQPVYGRPLSDIASVADLQRHISPEQFALIEATAANAVETGDIASVDYETQALDGSTIWVESRGRAVYDENGVATHLRGMTTDITARKQNEEKLATSEARYRILADLNPQAIWMGSPEGRITYANQRFLDYMGLTMEAAADTPTWLSAYLAEDRPRVVEAWAHSVATGEEYEIEARMIRARDRAVRWWWLRALPIRDDSGKILNWLGVAIDIHDRKTHAEQLHTKQLETERQRAELEAVYESAPIGLALFDPVDFRYLRVNDRQAETLGLPKEQIIGRPIHEIAPLKEIPALFRRVAAGGSVRNHLIQGELPTRPGEHRFWNVSYSPVRNSSGVIEAIAAVIQEITLQKKAETALIQSEKLAAVGRLASSISHEINNPLEAITNILYLIDHDSTLSAELKPLVNMAQSELSRVCQIATQTLRFHRQSVRAAHVTAKHLVNAVLNLYQGRLNNSGITVEAEYASSTPILCFENDIRQVLNNLIANAIDAMRQNGGRLLIRAHDVALHTEHRPGGVRGVRITIADTGHGMSPEVRARIFEPFYTTKDLNGTGLGLWISSGIVDRHKGRLTLRSSIHPIHHGTIFSLLLPTEEEPLPLYQA